ncbi:hypothetical protein ZIOFF_036945 [Zingiber officinale]|uniref:Phosphomannose isomerase type I catalytic domain-containing protein n=1 Tax=Zingiber officinale TaxID=94328 RepID=A0A8J5L8X7_ZINOF|nr:hypothetical protein ZIOFF_036945 [Zingiber officinale]
MARLHSFLSLLLSCSSPGDHGCYRCLKAQISSLARFRSVREILPGTVNQLPGIVNQIPSPSVMIKQSQVGFLDEVVAASVLGPGLRLRMPQGGFDGGASEVTLKKWIQENPGVLGDNFMAKWGMNMPFLFRILLEAKALSIQVHSNKELARMLHMMWPNVYKDPNHKPEMAIALIEFKALCGFVNIEELKDVLNVVLEIEELVGNDETSNIICTRELNGYVNAKTVIQSVFTKLMSANKDAILALVSKIKKIS